jgi:hypothetical protein
VHRVVQVKGLIRSTESQQEEIVQFQHRPLDMLKRLEGEERDKLRCDYFRI